MSFLLKYRLLLSILLLIGCFFTLYPLYRFILDDDGIGYAMVTKRWAAGEYLQAINGYWSPLHSWLALPFYLAGIDLLAAFKFSNLLISCCLLYVLERLMEQMELNRTLRQVVLLTAIPMLLYMSFYQLAADILFCLLFCWYVLHCCSSNLFVKKGAIIIAVLIGVLAYLAKAYAFPLFIAHFIFWQCWLFKRSLLPEKKKQLVKNLVIGLGLFMILTLPWILALHYKYDTWTFGYSGKLNLSWKLTQSPVTQEALPFFLQPPYPQSPTTWEDPGYTKQHYLHSFSSFPIFIKQLKLVVHNVVAALRSFHELSFLAMGILFTLFLFVMRTGSSLMLLLLFSILLLPGGYLLVHIEPRFLWPAAFLLLLAGVYLLAVLFHTWRFRLAAKRIAWTVLILSFLVTPLDALQDMSGSNKDIHELAQQVQQSGISGKFASTPNEYSKMRKTAFLSGNQYLESLHQDYSQEQLLEAIKQERIGYYFYFYENTQDIHSIQSLPLFRQATQQFPYPSHQLIVLKMIR